MRRRRTIAAALAVAVLAVGGFAYSGVAGAAGDTVTDPADTPGGLDIASATLATGATVQVTVRTYSPFADAQTNFRVFMDTNGSGKAGYWVVADFDAAAGKPRALVGPAGSAHLTTVSVSRPDGQSLLIDVPGGLLGNPSNVSWAVTSVATGPDGSTLEDTAPDQPALSWSRVVPVFGVDPADTSVESSFFPDKGANVAVLVAANDVADAPAAAALAAVKGGPLLLTSGQDLQPEVAAELRRALHPGAPVYMVGGELMLAPTVFEAVSDAGFFAVRLDGPDRYSTSLAVAVSGLGGVSSVFLAPGDGGPDALVAAAAAGATGGAVVLTAGPSLTADVAAFLARPGLTVYAVGGTAATADPAATAVAGPDRYATSVMVAQRFFVSPAAVGLVSGASPGDASAAATAGEGHAPLLVVPSGYLPGALSDYLAGQQGVTVYAFGFAVAGDNSLLSQVRAVI